MSEDARGPEGLDVGEYCREVEAHLSRVNAGEIIRIAGAGFELVRGWALEGIPLSVVCHAISAKAERHRAGSAARPLRIEFCKADVRAVYEQWRRAVGITGRAAPGGDHAAEGDDSEQTSAETRRRVSLSRHLQRALDRLGAAVSRTGLQPGIRDALEIALADVGALADQARGVRGAARDALVAALADVDRRMLANVRAAVGPAELDRLAGDAARDLSLYRGRVADDVWRRSVDLGVSRQLRDELGLPVLEL
jgi:hypothetical protein